MTCKTCHGTLLPGWVACPNCGTPIEIRGYTAVRRTTNTGITQSLVQNKSTHYHVFDQISRSTSKEPSPNILFFSYFLLVASIITWPIARSWILFAVQVQLMLFVAFYFGMSNHSKAKKHKPALIGLMILWTILVICFLPTNL